MIKFENLAEYIKAFRKSHKYSMRKLARKTNVDVSTISKIEKGIIKKPNILTLKKICKELNLYFHYALELGNYTKEEIQLLKEND